jgi:hypothetical protein
VGRWASFVTMLHGGLHLWCVPRIISRNEEELGKIEVTKNDESECYLVTQAILIHSAIYIIQQPVAKLPC